MLRQSAWAWLLLLPIAPAASQSAPSAGMVQTAARNVAQIIASQCPGGTQRSGTGFVWPDPQHIVTARHVVAGCTQVRVQFPGGLSLSAQPERDRASEDLLVLRLSASSGRQPVTVRAALPPVYAKVAAIGYALGAPTPDDKLLTVTSANREPPGAILQDMLPAKFRTQIENEGPWKLTTAILRLDGNLVSGLSGAPIYAPDGGVVAIGAGGLQDGASGIVWAVRAHYLLNPQGWRPVAGTANLSRSSNLAFADQSPQASVPVVACGAFALARTRKVTLAVLARDTDDPRGLQQILGAVGGALSGGNNTPFDVWVDRTTGATIPLPAGTRIQPSPAGCIALIGPGVGINIATFRVPADNLPMAQQQIQAVSSNFEATYRLPFPQGLPADPSFTYTIPVSRPDGFIANRKAWGAPQIVGPNRLALNYVFMTHMTRGDSYAGIGAMRWNFEVPLDKTISCNNGNRADCQLIQPALEVWAKAAISVFMATIPPI